jgi:outer membrane protein OmpA-like peptidoglycan-associated protein
MTYFSPELDSESEDDQDSSVLLSIGDLMSGLLMFFMLLFILVLGQLIERPTVNLLIGTLEKELKGNSINVVVNQKTGDVSVRESILFDEGSAELKPAGKAFLKRFIPVYSAVIFSKPQFSEEITKVVVEGHTSSKGSYQTNMELSLLRSLAVSNYIFSEDFRFSTKSQLSQKVLVSGRGEIDANQKQDTASDRKVVFRFQFKGDSFSQLTQQP